MRKAGNILHRGRAGLALIAWVMAATAMSGAGDVRAADLPSAEPDPIRAAFFDDATFSLHARAYLFDSSNAGDEGPAASAIGGWAGYETGWIGDILQFGVVGYTSQPLWAPRDREGSLLLLPDGDGFSVIGQAYAALRYSGQELMLYRQIVDQPEVNPHDNRMAPNTFEGVTLAGDLDSLSYYAGVLTRMKRQDSDHFVNMADVAGVDSDEMMYLGGLTFSPNRDVDVRSSLYVVPNLLLSSYSDGNWSMDLAGGDVFELSGQFMVQTGIGAELLTGPDFAPWVLGVMGEFTHGGLTLTAGYTANGSDDEWQSPYGDWPGYTSMQINDFDRAGEQALLLGAAYDFTHHRLDGLSLAVLAAVDIYVADDLPLWREYDFTAAYRLSEIDTLPAWLTPLSLSAQYALVQSEDEDGRSDLSDQLRLIANYEIKTSGKDLLSLAP